jgi:TolB protein
VSPLVLVLRRLLWRLVPAGSILILFLSPARAQAPTGGSQEKELTIQKGAIPKVPIIVEDFVPGTGATAGDAAKVGKVAADDLDFADAFKITLIPRVTGNEPELGIAQALVRGTVDMSGGNLVLHGTLESLPGRTRMFSRDYRVTPEAYREAAHRFADDIVLTLTGSPGIARTKIAFMSDRSGSKEIYVVDYDGNGLRQVTKNGSINMSPAWSPDARKLAYVSFRKGDPDIYVVDLYGGGDRLVLGGQGVQSSPAFSPDGNSILYSQTAGRESEIYVAGAGGERPRRVTRVGGINTSPSWSRDGRQFVFTSDRAGTPQLYIAEIDGGAPRRITFDGTWNDLADWDPTGNRIAYASRQDGVFQIRVVDPSGMGEERPVTFGPGREEHPSWAPDGRHLVFVSSRGGGPGLWILEVDGGRLRPLVERMGNVAGPAWSPAPPR